MVKIAHTADIHIRSLSRHDEYRKTFEDFIKDCHKQRVDHIFVGGDIFHTKTTGISPEYIDLLTWWLDSMADVAQVHLILGNHDGNLVNTSRQDAVSPIVDAMANPRVHLYKKSGVYEFEPGYTFCVYSLFDEPGWSSVVPQPDKVNIACYHGPVFGSETESNWAVEDGIKTDFFAQYPFTFLGDIHKRQHLVVDEETGLARMSYPGTLIQQNYAEIIEHGYLLWEIESADKWNVIFRQLPNDKPFVTIDWKGSVEATAKFAKKYPLGSRLRIRSQEPLRQDEIHLLSETLKTTVSPTEVTYKSTESLSSQEISTGASTVVKSDLRSPEVILKLFKEFHDSKLDDATAQLTETQIKQTMAVSCGGDDVARGSKWSLQQLKWNNTFAYGEDNIIDFGNANGIVGIFGSNRTGKSSIIGTLMYSLFNTTDRGPVKNMFVCNVRKPQCSANVLISHDGSIYSIERQTTKSANKRGIVSASTALNLFKLRDDGEVDDLCGEQRTDTEKTIRGLIGSSEDFLLTSLSAQGDINQFISQGSSRRRQILTKFLDLDIFDKMHDHTNKELNALKAQLRNYPERNWEESQEEIAIELKQLEHDSQDLHDKVTESQTKMTLLRDAMSKHNVKPVTMADVEAQKLRVETLRQKSETCKQKMQVIADEIVTLQEKATAVQDVIDRYDVDALRRRLEGQRKLESSIVELRHVFERENENLKRQQKSLKILDEVPCGDDYPTCKFIKDAHVNKSTLSKQQSTVTAAAKTLQDATSAFESSRDDTIVDKIAKHDKAVALLAKINLEISSKETETERLRSSCSSCDSSLVDAQQQLANLSDAIKNEENAEVVSIRAKIQDLSESIKKLDALRLEASTRRGMLLASSKQLMTEKAARDSILEKMHVHEMLTTAFSKRGIPLNIMKSQLPLINGEVAKILHGIVDFTVELESDEETDSLEIYINYGDSRRIIELCSGMEKTISSLALRVAMINVSSLPKSDIFIIDEGFGTLDAAGIEACNRLLVSLKRYFRTIVVITHVDGIKDSADHIIEITKNEKDSKVLYQ